MARRVIVVGPEDDDFEDDDFEGENGEADDEKMQIEDAGPHLKVWRKDL